MSFSFALVEGGYNLPMSYAGICSQENVLCAAPTYWVCRFTQADLDRGQEGEMVSGFSKGRYSLGLEPSQYSVWRLPKFRGIVCQNSVLFCLCLLLFAQKKRRNGQRHFQDRQSQVNVLLWGEYHWYIDGN
jgi:hypothetical protein